MTKIFWLICTVVAAVALYFTYQAAEKLFLYLSTDSRKLTDRVEFKATSGSWGRYYLTGMFQYSYQDKTYEASTELRETVFMNEALAKEKALEAKDKKWTVYFNSARPNWATLERRIPLKEIVYALLSWISLGYILIGLKKLKV